MRKGGGVWCPAPNPDPISGQKMSLSDTRFQTRPLKSIPAAKTYSREAGGCVSQALSYYTGQRSERYSCRRRIARLCMLYKTLNNGRNSNGPATPIHSTHDPSNMWCVQVQLLVLWAPPLMNWVKWLSLFIYCYFSSCLFIYFFKPFAKRLYSGSCKCYECRCNQELISLVIGSCVAHALARKTIYVHAEDSPCSHTRR